MNTNNVFRQVRHALNLSVTNLAFIFSLNDKLVTSQQINRWLARDEDKSFEKMPDKMLAHFLNGLIIKTRGARDGEKPVAEERMTNNLAFFKLRIAFALKDFEIIDILDIVNFKIRKAELNAFFRKPGQVQHKPCKDQILRNFIRGLGRYVEVVESRNEIDPESPIAKLRS